MRRLIVLPWVALVGCAMGQAAPVASGGAEAPTTIGVASYNGSVIAAADAEALTRYLTLKLGRPAAARTFPNAAELTTALATGAVDLAWLPPFAFVNAQARSPVTGLAKAVRHGRTYYRGVLFTREDRKLDGLAALQGSSVAWVAKDSTAGYLFPRALLIEAGLKPETLFTSETFAGTHLDVCRAVLEGRASVGATFADDRDNEPPRVDGCEQSMGAESTRSLEILGISAPIPNDVVGTRANLPGAQVDQLRQLFLELGQSAEGQKLLKDVFNAERFAAIEADDFEPVRYAASVAQ
jgi:phosphonate transport system substrate-binding protein